MLAFLTLGNPPVDAHTKTPPLSFCYLLLLSKNGFNWTALDMVYHHKNHLPSSPAAGLARESN
jgi:hypothetical protein